LAGGAVVGQQCKAYCARGRFGWVAARGCGLGVEVRGPQTGGERVDLDPVASERLRIEHGQRVERGLRGAVCAAGAGACRLMIELRVGGGAPSERSGRSRC